MKYVKLFIYYNDFDIVAVAKVYPRFNIILTDYSVITSGLYWLYPFRMWMTPSGIEKRACLMFGSLYKNRKAVKQCNTS
jgi:hypothetical protein